MGSAKHEEFYFAMLFLGPICPFNIVDNRKKANMLEMANRRVKWSEIWDSGIYGVL